MNGIIGYRVSENVIKPKSFLIDGFERSRRSSSMLGLYAFIFYTYSFIDAGKKKIIF
jgi:hypothetical protein